jgi:hypothetical protein
MAYERQYGRVHRHSGIHLKHVAHLYGGSSAVHGQSRSSLERGQRCPWRSRRHSGPSRSWSEKTQWRRWTIRRRSRRAWRVSMDDPALFMEGVAHLYGRPGGVHRQSGDTYRVCGASPWTIRRRSGTTWRLAGVVWAWETARWREEVWVRPNIIRHRAPPVHLSRPTSSANAWRSSCHTVSPYALDLNTNIRLYRRPRRTVASFTQMQYSVTNTAGGWSRPCSRQFYSISKPKFARSTT